MHSYWLQAISNDRIGTLSRQADQRRLVAAATRVPTEPLSTRLHERFVALLASVAPLARRLQWPQSQPQPQPCTC